MFIICIIMPRVPNLGIRLIELKSVGAVLISLPHGCTHHIFQCLLLVRKGKHLPPEHLFLSLNHYLMFYFVLGIKTKVDIFS